MHELHAFGRAATPQLPTTPFRPWIPALMIATATLAACGGGGGDPVVGMAAAAGTSSTGTSAAAPTSSTTAATESPTPVSTTVTSTFSRTRTGSTSGTTSSSTGSTSTSTGSTSTSTGSTSTGSASTGSTSTGSTTAATGRWVPAVSDTWNWQLSGTIKTDVNAKVYDIDLFDNSAATIASLKAAGRRVVCYFSAGTSENWRSDYAQFAAADKGSSVAGWAGENWLDTRSANVRNVMKARLDLAVSKGCDGVEPDNVDGYTNSPGFPLTSATQVDYNTFLANEAHARGLAIALKNTVDLLSQLEPYFDFAVNEQCNEYSECGGYSVFTSKGKPVFNAEYASKWASDATARASLCTTNRAANIRTLVLPLALDGSFRYSCD